MLRKSLSCAFAIMLSLNVYAVTLVVSSANGTYGGEIIVPVKVADFNDLVSMQGSIVYDASVLSFKNAEQFGLSDLSSANFGNSYSGYVTFAWYDPYWYGVTVADSTTIFALRFEVISTSSTTSYIEIDDYPTDLEFIDYNWNYVYGTYIDGTVTANAGSTSSDPCDNVTVSVNLGYDQVLCDGSSLTLSAGYGYSSYSWSTGSSSSSITVYDPGIYSVTVTNSDGCEGFDYVGVTSNTQCNELYFSEYIEGSSLNQAVEIYNPTSSTVNLSGYSVDVYSNGATSATWSIPLSGSVSSHDVFVLVNYNATLSSLTSAADQTSGWLTFNGNDAVVLQKYGDAVDLIGAIGDSSVWYVGGGSTQDHTLVREYSVTSGQLSWTSGKYEWDDYSQNYTSKLGSHSSACYGYSGSTFSAGPDTSICEGESIQLYATGGVNYQWDYSSSLSSTTSSTPIATPSYTTTYYVDIEDSYGCTTTESVTVIVNSSPSVYLGYDYSTTNSSETLDAGSGYVSYLWSTGETTQTIDVTTTGSYSVVVEDADGCLGDDAITVTFSDPCANANVSVSLGYDKVLCDGSSLTLSAGYGYSSYEWNTGYTSSSITVTTPGTYYVTVSNSDGCEGSDTVVISSNKGCNELFISEYLEGSSNNKGIEIYNPTSSSVDLSNYAIEIYANGSSSAGYIINLSTTLSSKSVYVVAHSSSSISYLTSNTDQFSGSLSFNGNDAVALTKNGNLIDVIGEIGDNSTWIVGSGSTQDYTLERKSSVTSGQLDWATGVSEWNIYSKDDAYGFGYHSSSCSSSSSSAISISSDTSICEGESIQLYVTGGVSYQWDYSSSLSSTTSSTPTATPSYTTTYYVDIEDSYGCTTTESVTVTVNSVPAVYLGSDFGTTNSSEVLDAGSGYSSYLWNTGETTQTITVTSTGTYWVVVTNADGCEADDAITVTFNTVDPCANSTLSVNLGSNFTSTNSSEVLDAGSGYSSYLWNTGETTQTITVTSTGTYWVVVTNADGCEADDAITVTFNTVDPCANSTLSVNLGSDFTSTNSSEVLDAGSGYSSYYWSSGETTQTISVTKTGTYWVIVTDSNGCKGDDAIVVTFSTLVNKNLTFIIDTITSTTGSQVVVNVKTVDFIDMLAFQGTITFDPAILSFNQTEQYGLTGLNATSFGTTQTSSGLLTVAWYDPSLIGNTLTDSSVVFAIRFDILGSSGTMSDISFANAPTKLKFFDISYNSVGATLIDGWVKVMDTTIVNPCVNSSVHDLDLGSDVVLCNNDTVVLDAGLGYSGYTWSDNSVDQFLEVFLDGLYYVTVSDGNGCTATDSVYVTYVTTSDTVWSDDIICNGSVKVLDPGSGFESYLWSTGDTTQTIEVSESGVYYAELGDINGCSYVSTHYLSPNALYACDDLFFSEYMEGSSYNKAVEIYNPTSDSVDLSDYAIQIFSNGNTSYSSNILLTGMLASGGVWVVAHSSCDYSKANYYTGSLNFNGNDAIALIKNNTEHIDIIGQIGTDSVWVVKSGSTKDYTLTRDYNVQQGELDWDKSVGNWKIYGQDDTTYLGYHYSICLDSGINYVGAVNDKFQLCEGETATLEVIGGLAYEWYADPSLDSTNSAVTVASPVVTTTYLIDIEDKYGCIITDSIWVDVNSRPDASLNNSSSSICATSTALAPDTGFVAYLWSDSTTNPSLTIYQSGIYWVMVTDTNNCTGSDTVSIELGPDQYVSLGNDTSICSDTGTVIINAGNDFSSYLWSDGSTGNTIKATASGSYYVEVFDDKGCPSSDSILVLFGIGVVLDEPSSLCYGDSAMLDAGSGYISYLWSDGSNSQTIITKSSGSYYVVATDIDGCVSSDTVEVAIDNILPVDLGNDTIVCSGSFAVLDAGGNASNYNWSTGSDDQVVYIDSSGTYFVDVININGCFSTDTVLVKVVTSIKPDLGAAQTICQGDSTKLYPGSGYISYMWSDGSTSPYNYAYQAGYYYVIVKDSNGCSNSATVNIYEYPTPPVNLGNDTLWVCEGEDVKLEAGTGYISYEWSTGDTATEIVVSNLGTYTVTVTDSNGCVSTDRIVLECDVSGVRIVSGNYLFEIYPNPANNEIKFMTDLKVNKVEIINIIGERVKLFENYEMNSSINIADLKPGGYLLNAYTTPGVIQRKMIIVR